MTSPALTITELQVGTVPGFDAHERVVRVQDAASGLHAIIAIHSTHLGPAAGGVRRWTYAGEAEALGDALCLSRAMSYKNAMAGLPAGGGKAVMLADAPKTPTLLAAFGDAVAALDGRYVTVHDVGMTDADLVAIAARTPHVAGLPVPAGAVGGNPGPFTARGVLAGIRAAVAHRLARSDLAGLAISVQGLGKVGGALAQLLAAAGARLTVADADAGHAARLAAALGARAVAVDAILSEPADVFSPNALGGILNEASIAALDCAIVAGAANNQLATPEDGAQLARRAILYAPDYVINAGGIISVVAEYLHRSGRQPTTLEAVTAQIDAIGPRLAALFAEADASGRPTNDVADAMARGLIGRGQ